MHIGIPKERKDQEHRVALTPQAVRHVAEAGHRIRVERGAGLGSGFSDHDYAEAGAQLCDTAAAWDSDLVLKVKEPLATEYGYLRDQSLFTFLHLAGAPLALTSTLLERKTTALAYETLENSAGELPLLAPMSAIAGNMAAMIGAYYLARFQGGNGVQLGNLLGRRYGKVLIVGDGVVAHHAARSASGMGTNVFVAGLDPRKGAAMRRDIGPDLVFLESSREAIGLHLRDADVLIGAVLTPGARADFVVSEEMITTMGPGSVVIDVSIDQGGCIETSRPTSHSNPVYGMHDVIHYCVTNMPGAYPRTATVALSEAVLPYVLRLANNGLQALREDRGFRKALNAYQGSITCQPVAQSLGLTRHYQSCADALDTEW